MSLVRRVHPKKDTEGNFKIQKQLASNLATFSCTIRNFPDIYETDVNAQILPVSASVTITTDTSSSHESWSRTRTLHNSRQRQSGAEPRSDPQHSV